MQKTTVNIVIGAIFLLIPIWLWAGFGSFASAVYVNNSYYNLAYDNTSVAVNSGGPDFNGANLGLFTQYSSTLKLQGAQLRTWKDGNGNVCGGTIYYRYYLANGTPGSFNSITIPFGCNCGDAGCFTTSCGGGDQIWRNESEQIDLTNLCPGNYKLEVYVAYSGDDNTTYGCGTTKYISNNGANYIADFTITSSLSVTTNDVTLCEGLPLNLNSTVTGGDTTTYTYSWLGPNGFSSSDPNPFVNNSAQTTHAGTYTLSVTDGCGYTSPSKSLIVTVNPLPVTNPINQL